MVATPAATPVTTPEEEPTVATSKSELVHTPPVTVLVRVVVAPTHTVGVPPIVGGIAFTVSVAILRQVVGSMYEIVEPIVATVILLLLHVPPPVALLRVVVAPKQILIEPVINAGVAFTVIIALRTQPVTGAV